MSDRIFDKTLDTLSKSMHYRQLNQNIITSNIANAETPNFKALNLDFELALQNAREGKNKMLATNKNHYAVSGGIGKDSIGALVYENPDFSSSNDLNTVDIEKEMTRLTGNQIMFDAATKLMNKKLGLLKYAISEGGR